MPIDRSRIYRGMFIKSDQPLPGWTPGPARLAPASVEKLADFNRKHAAAVHELARRLQAVRDELARFQKARRK
jgi:hypothetical protein